MHPRNSAEAIASSTPRGTLFDSSSDMGEISPLGASSLRRTRASPWARQSCRRRADPMRCRAPGERPLLQHESSVSARRRASAASPHHHQRMVLWPTRHPAVLTATAVKVVEVIRVTHLTERQPLRTAAQVISRRCAFPATQAHTENPQWRDDLGRATPLRTLLYPWGYRQVSRSGLECR